MKAFILLSLLLLLVSQAPALNIQPMRVKYQVIPESARAKRRRNR